MRQRISLTLIIVLLVFAMPTLTQDTSGFLLEDDFSDQSRGWQMTASATGITGYENEAYAIMALQYGEVAWSASGNSFTDIAIDIDTTSVVVPTSYNNSYGVMCRVQENGDGYAFHISDDGYASIMLIEEGYYWPLSSWIQTDAILPDNNHMQAICSGETFILFVNGVAVIDADDATFAEGDVGLSVITFEEDSPTQINFDNLVVESMPVIPDYVIKQAQDSIMGLPSELPIEDDFRDEYSGWEVGNYDIGYVEYLDDQYAVAATFPGQFMWGALGGNFYDTIIEVKAKQFVAPSDNSNAFGVVCRLQPNADGYYLLISGDGHAVIMMILDGEFVSLSDWVATREIKQGNHKTNRLKVICNKDEFELHVNGELIVTAIDDTFANGDIALAAVSLGDGMTEVHFDDFSVEAPVAW